MTQNNNTNININDKQYWESYGRVRIFIDAANILYCQHDMGWTIDFKKFMRFFTSTLKDFKGAHFYFALWFQKNSKRAAEEKMIKMLEKTGYKVTVKDSKKVAGSVKANCDVELAIDAIRYMSTYDTVLLFSGDGDFSSLCRYLKEHKKKVLVVSYRDHISYELVKEADLFISLDKLGSVIRYTKTP